MLCPDEYGNTVNNVKPWKCSFENANLFDRVSGGFKLARASGIFAGNMGYRAHAIIRLSP